MSARIQRNQVGIPERSSKQDAARASVAQDRATAARIEAALDWARQNLPDLCPQFENWVADAVLMLRWQKRPVNVNAVKRHMAAAHPWLPEAINEAKGES